MRPTNKQLAESEYRRYLTLCENVVGNKSTYLTDLENLCLKLFKTEFMGVFPSDKIPKLNKIKNMCILNLDRSDQSGSHWVSLVYDYDEGKSMLYDSFGRKNSKIINKVNYSGNGRVIDSELDPEQKISESNCGARCVAFLCVFHKYGFKIAKYV